MIDARNRSIRLLTIHLLLFLLLFARRSEALTEAQFWAEDGAIFFAEQVRFGFFHAVSSTYAGYYHLLPRLIAGAACGLPTNNIPFAYNLSALLIASLCCGMFAWPMFRHLIASDSLRAATCFVASSAVYPGNEVLGNITNLQWFLLIAGIMLISYGQTRETKAAWVYLVLAGADLLIALSTPLLVIVIPWLLWQALKKTGLARLPPLCALAGSFFEIFTFLRSSEPHAGLHVFRFSSFLVAVIASEISRPVLITALGHQYLIKGGVVGVASKFITALILASAGLTGLYSSLRSRGRIILAVVLYFSLASIAAVMLGRNLANAFTDPIGFRFLEAERYFFLPAFLVVFLLAFAVNHVFGARSSLFKAVVLALLFSVGITNNFSLPPLADFSWSHYAPQVDAWTAKRRRGEHPPRLAIPINPQPFVLILE